MATTQEAIARLRMIFETQGADAAAAEMKKLEASSTSLGTSSLNLDRAFTGLERRYSETARASAEYERSMRTLNAAVAQNPALAERAAAVQQTIAARYQATMQAAHQAAQSQTALGQVNQAMQAQMQGLAASTGLFGSALSTLGRGGLIAATGIGAAVVAYQKLSGGISGTIEYVRQTSRLAEVTGLTTTQIQGINKEASRLGIESEKVAAGLSRFTANFDELRHGTGPMLDSIREVNSGLAEQMMHTENEDQALRLLQKGLSETTNEFQKAKLARASYGREGSVLAQVDISRGLGRTTGLSSEQIEHIKQQAAEVEVRWTSAWNKIYASMVPAVEATKLALANLVDPDTEAKLHVLTMRAAELAAEIERLREVSAEGGAYFGKGFDGAAEAADIYAKKLEGINAQIDALKKKQAGGEAPPLKLTALLPTAEIAEFQKLQGLLGGLIDPMQAVEYEAKALAIALGRVPEEFREQLRDAIPDLMAFKAAQAELAQVAPGTGVRQLAAIQAIKAEYPGLVAQDAIRMSRLDDQLRIAQAMPGVTRMAAEEEARINQLLLEGKELMLATTIAARERAVAVAQINSAADLQLQQLREEYNIASAVTGAQRMQAQAQATYNQLVQQGVSADRASAIATQQAANAQAQLNANARQTAAALRDQAAVAGAVTGAQRMAAEAAATFNQLVRQGVGELEAGEVAAQGLANAIAAANANVERQVNSLNNSTNLIHAQNADLNEQWGLEQKILGTNEINARVQQTYNEALETGAENAGELAAATERNLRAQQQLQISKAEEAEDMKMIQAEQARASSASQYHGTTISGIFSAPLQELQSLESSGSAIAWRFMHELLASGGAGTDFLSAAQPTIEAARREIANKPLLEQRAQAAQSAQDQLLAAQEALALSQVSDQEQKARLQAEYDRQSMIRGGMDPNMAAQIASIKLETALNELKKSVDQNTDAQTAALDPIYTQGRAALRIGYYGEGSGGTMRTVTGTGYAGAANENLPMPQLPAAPAVAPASQEMVRGNVIVVNNMFTAAAMGDRRTQYQSANAYGRAIANI